MSVSYKFYNNRTLEFTTYSSLEELISINKNITIKDNKVFDKDKNLIGFIYVTLE